MDVPPIDPLEISSIQVDTGNTGSVNLVIALSNCRVSGLRNLKIENLKANLEDNISFSAILTVPKINIEGTYKLKGKILLFELNGQGHISFNASKYQFDLLFIFTIINASYFILGDIRTDSLWLGNTYLKKNKKHINIDRIQFNDVQIKNIRVNYEDLFESQALTETVTNAINENVDTLRDELEPIIKETLIQVILEYFNRVYSLFPMDQLFPIE